MQKKIKYLIILIIAIVLQIVSTSNTYALPTSNLETNTIQFEEINIDQPIPKLKSTKQISTNQLLITYDMEVDLTKGITPTNYWIQSVTDTKPVGIATLGKDDKVSSKNSLTSNNVTIAPKDSTNTSFIITFNQPIGSSSKYNLIICYITAPNGEAYTGDNGSAIFVGK
ncbi:MAG: hypothetical protein RSA29_07690 [Clostridium sp.]